MSKYKTPIRIHINSTRKVNDKIGRYRLPFSKDEAVEEKTFSLSMVGNDALVISSELVKEHQFQTPFSKFTLKEKKSQRIEEVPEKQKSDKGEKNCDNGEDMHQEEIIQNNQIKVQLVEERRSEVMGSARLLPASLYENPLIKKFRYQTTIGQYQEEDVVLADRSQRTDIQAQTKGYISEMQEKKIIKKSSEDILPVLISKKQAQRRVLHQSLKKQETKTWDVLSKQLQEYKSQSLKKEFKKRKRLKSQNIIGKHLARPVQEENRCLFIENELKRINRQQSQADIINKQDPYSDLIPIPEDDLQTNTNKNNNKHNGFIQKLKIAIDRQQKVKPPKLKFHLDHYLQNFYKIKQINPFFRKLNELAGCIMLSIGKLKIVESGNLIYDQGQPLAYLYIIVVGKVALVNSYKSFKKYTLTGQTLGEELLFEEGRSYQQRLSAGVKPMFHRQEARAISRVCILRIKPQKYYKVNAQLSSIGSKGLFNLIDNLFRINYFKKQAISHGKRERIPTEASLHSRYKQQYFLN